MKIVSKQSIPLKQNFLLTTLFLLVDRRTCRYLEKETHIMLKPIVLLSIFSLRSISKSIQ